ncbi:hypothetical protein FHS95_003116 [Sphingomonas naasensis]|uniref:Lipoprotein n=1 Tax=Sphingomonas naasensis TaxID=1344951 RepID=A0A4S1WKU4_9SPHN|nr:hypothetical protein [Sphingomonas naasensis]NIJ21413.1 hypothetical protein [Sphingomonas naasensis]TGX41626.1 hypothetical protein E5A74_13530 [Sphingomonas naasensis]
MIRAAVSIAALAALAGCDMVPEKPPTPAPSHRATPVAAASSVPPAPAERLAAALRVVPVDKASRYAFGGDDRLIDTPSGPVLLRHGHVPDGSHADGGVIAAYYLRPQNDGFALVKAFPEAATSGSFGDLGKWSVSADFAAVPVLMVEGGGTWQGCTVGLTDLVALQPGGPASLASVTTSFDTSGMSPDSPETLTGSFADIVRDRGFTVRYEGTRAFAERYVRRGARFQPEGGESQVPGC